MSPFNAINAKAIELGKLAVEMTTAAGSGHPSTALSLAHLVTVLMYQQMRWDPKDPWSTTADRLVLSEGHAVPIIYAACADLGVMITPPGKGRDAARPMTRDDAMTLREISSPIDGHPHPQVGFPFFDAATGSLGQGLSVAAGLGIAAQRDHIDRNVYCLIGDGESREGQIWEAMDLIVDQALTNVIPIFNCNELAQSDWVSPQQSFQSIFKKSEAFGFIARVIDGHDPDSITRALSEIHVIQNGHRPLAIIARTIKGWGSPSEQGMGKHGTAVREGELGKVLGELEATKRRSDEATKGGGDCELRIADCGLKTKPNPQSEIRDPKSPKPETRNPKPDLSFEQGLALVGLDQSLAQRAPLAPRKAYGAALVALGQNNPLVVALDADVKNSTHAEWFARQFPDRFVECKIAEQNMISVAAGMAAAGKIPFVSTFAKFVERAYDQVEMAIISGANLKITGSHAGVTLAADGPSQMSLPDVAFFRSFCHTTNFNGRPAITYFFPSDAVSCYHCTHLMAQLDGACYQRTLRADVPILYKPDETFEPGGFKVLREGKDLTLVAAGYMVHECLRVADELAKSNRSATVIDAYSLPLNATPLLDIATRSGNRIITVEDNYAGGLEAELAAAIATAAAPIRLTPIYVRQIPKSGREPEDVLAYLHLDAAAIYKHL